MIYSWRHRVLNRANFKIIFWEENSGDKMKEIVAAGITFGSLMLIGVGFACLFLAEQISPEK